MEWWRRWKERTDMGRVRADLVERADKIKSAVLSHFPSANELKMLQIGPAANGEIHFLPGKRYAIDPLANYFKKNFSELMDPEVDFIEGMGEDLPYKDAFFDVIMIINVLDHCFDPDKVLKEMDRCLRKGGLLILTVNAYSSLAALIHQTFKFLDREHPHALTVEYFKKHLIPGYEFVKESFRDVKAPDYDLIKRLSIMTARSLKLIPLEYTFIAKKKQ